jgi:hypothetical protein
MPPIRKVIIGGVIAFAAILPNEANAFSINLTDQVGDAPSRSFSNGSFTITFKPSSSSPQAFVSSSGNGLCLYANSTNATSRCHISGTTPPNTYNLTQMTSNQSIYLTGGSVRQITGTASSISISSLIGGPSLATIPNTTGNFNFARILVSNSRPLYFMGSGTDTATRIESFSFDEVPGPLPVLGAAAAFGWSRRLRRKLKQSNG